MRASALLEGDDHLRDPIAITTAIQGDRCASKLGLIAQKFLCLVQIAHHLVDHSTSRNVTRTMEPRNFPVAGGEKEGCKQI